MLLESMSLNLNVEGPPPSVPATICSIAFLHTFSPSLSQAKTVHDFCLMFRLTLYRFLQTQPPAKVLQGSANLSAPN